MLKPLKILTHLSAAALLLSLSQANALVPPSYTAYVTALNFILFDDSGWTPEQVQEQANSTQAVFSQCQLGINNVRVFRMHAPNGSGDLSKFDFDGKRNIARLAELATDLPHPLVFLIKGMAPSDAQDRPFSRAKFIDGQEQYPQALLDTVWFPDNVNSEAYKAEAPYVVLAHELTHVLTLDGDHNNDDPPNLMTVAPRRTNTLTADLCKKIVSSRFVQPNPASLIATLINLNIPGN